MQMHTKKSPAHITKNASKKRTKFFLTEEVGCMSGPPVRIELEQDAKPYHCITARRVPVQLHDKVKAELKRMVDMGVITPVTTPTDWCAPMVTVVEPNGKVRICVDLKRLNKSVKRSHFLLPTVDDTLSKLAGAR